MLNCLLDHIVQWMHSMWSSSSCFISTLVQLTCLMICMQIGLTVFWIYVEIYKHNLLRHKKYLGTRIPYYGNSSATFQHDILLAGDINPNPGPELTANNCGTIQSHNAQSEISHYSRADILELNKYNIKAAPPLPQLLWNHIKSLGISAHN